MKPTGFSFEVLPPLKGMGIDKLFADIAQLREFEPQCINITTHRSECIYRATTDGLYERVAVRKRPGTVAVAAAIKAKWNIPVVPHILCSGFTREETEYVLIDLQFLGITDLLVLRGDKARDDRVFTPVPGGHSHAIELQGQINRFNEGFFDDGSPIPGAVHPFSYGVACYPEKHAEAPNLQSDLHWLLKKQEAGAQYAVTQLFYDNAVYFRFVEQARAAGVTLPIIPGLKPLTKASQLSVVPTTFNVDIPAALSEAVTRCRSDEEVRRVGVEWCKAQCRELIQHGVPRLHFYALGATQSVREVAKEVF